MPTSVESTDTEDSERLLNDGTQSSRSWKYRDEKRRRRYGCWWTLGLLSLTTALSCLVGLFIEFQSQDLDQICSRHVSHYSPVLSNVPIMYHQQRFNGSLLKENIFRQDAGPEVDAAWEALGVNYRPIRVPVEEATRSGLAPDQVRINPASGGGYPANIEGLHHLHCLNLLRQSLYYNYDHYHSRGDGAFKNDDYILRRHVSHCLDILRQQLMCTIDIGVLGQVWIHPEHPSPFLDFNTEHRCRNFEDIRDWAERNQLPEDPPRDFLQPPGVGDRIFHEIP
ncbi:hypothetical protein BDW59DRAFT_181645 [Aspergillus cavernicola]|uniref:Tat pathway signal sequence n=1 Tax=Aspergillus cavernicola TaxID=176166 RepID=A0ABR4HVQ4_9EURO